MLKRILSAVATAAALLYFLLDALALGILRPVLAYLQHHPLLLGLGRWVASLGPYPTLIVVAVPLLLLEPLKLIGVYAIAAGHPLGGAALVAVGEVLKVVTVERLFRMGRPKLLTIPWFAWGYRHAAAWLDRLRASRPWQAARRIGFALKARAKRLLFRIRRFLA